MTHADAVRELPRHHRDPFDRLLVAQTQVENLAIVSRDPAFRAYEVQLTLRATIRQPATAGVR